MIDTYLAAQASRLAASTVRESTRAVREFDKWLAGRTISMPVLLDWHGHLSRRKLENTTKNLTLTHVKAYLSHLIDMGHEPLPLHRLKGFRVERKQPVVLSREEIRRLYDACNAAEDRPTARAVLCILFTGCRAHETLLLQPECVKQDALLIHSKKTGERLFPWFLLGRARSLFKALPFTWSSASWTAIRKAAGLNGLKIKSLRSTFVTYALSSGKVSAYNCAKIAGHTPSVSESHYQGSPVWGLQGEDIVAWYGLAM